MDKETKQKDVKELPELGKSKEVDITKMSLTELKALAYDEISRLEISQNNLRFINAEISKRQKE